MAGFVADVASLSVVRAVPGQVAHLVAGVTGLRGDAVDGPPLRAAPRYMPRLIAVVAGRSVRALVALLGEVALAVAPVATFGVLLAVASKVPKPVALVALLAGPAVAVTAGLAAPTSTSSGLGALAGEVSGTIAFVAHTGTHLTSSSNLTQLT